MKTASMVLGIVGGVIAVILGLLYIFWLSTFFSDLFGSFFYSDADFDFSVFSDMYYTMFTVMGILSVVGGVLGLIGGIIVKKHNIPAGVMMIVAGVMSVSFLLFILAGIFALIKDKQQVQQYPPYPPAPNAPQS
jgi:hypothetical protein